MKYIHVFENVKSEDWYAGLVEPSINANNINLFDTTDELLSHISADLSDHTLIDGGHYPLEQEDDNIIHKPNKLTVFAFELAVKFFKAAQNLRIKTSLGFLINDMGLDTDARNAFKNEITLHPLYLSILQNNNLTVNDIAPVFFESNLRNRSSRQILRKGFKSGIVKAFESLLYMPDMSDTVKEADFSNYLGQQSGSLLIPFCRAIIAQKLADAESMGFKKVINLLTEHEFKCLGEFAKVYHFFGGENDVLNVLLSPFELTQKQNVKYHHSQFSSSADVYFLNNDAHKYFMQIQKYNKIPGH